MKTMVLLLILAILPACAQEKPEESMFEEDTIITSAGPLKITFIGHGTLMLTFGGTVIHIDPVGSEADYTKLPKADLILVTHEHRDHLDPEAIQTIRKDTVPVVLTQKCQPQIKDSIVMKNGDTKTVAHLRIEAVPAYNLLHMRSPGQPFHPKGVGNGYIITFGETRVYIAGDTENTPEMKSLKDIDVAFLPMNLPYTMTPEMVADAAKAFQPKILYPYHFGDTHLQKLVDLLADTNSIEVRLRKMQ